MNFSSNFTLYTALFVLFSLIDSVFNLECYICANQSSNTGKCIKTIMTCDVHEDRCMSFVRWSNTPYWAPSAEKQHFVSKRCAAKKACQSTIHKTMPRCRRLWYEDWECAECCQGNRCNYFITLGSSHAESSLMLVTAVLALSSLLRIFHS